MQYQTVLVWLREYDPEFPAEHNWPKLADVMGISLDEFGSRYLFSRPVAPSPPPPGLEERVEALARQNEDLREELAALRSLLEERQGTGR